MKTRAEEISARVFGLVYEEILGITNFYAAFAEYATEMRRALSLLSRRFMASMALVQFIAPQMPIPAIMKEIPP